MDLKGFLAFRLFFKRKISLIEIEKILLYLCHTMTILIYGLSRKISVSSSNYW